MASLAHAARAPHAAAQPDVTYSDIGGCDQQKQEIREAVELPLTHFDLYKQIGIDPPRGVLLYGPPGTGKTMITRAVAAMTKANFIRVNGSEFVQKYLGEGPRMVRDVFRLARDNAPAIIFIDEVDAIATKRFDAQTGADREVQRPSLLIFATSILSDSISTGAAHFARASDPNGRLRPVREREGHHGHQQAGHTGPRAAAPWPPRSQGAPPPALLFLPITQSLPRRSSSPSQTAGKSASSLACAPPK
jgi:SpoVK/Ycf46/Vps4 family AAA+-type ATPase